MSLIINISKKNLKKIGYADLKDWLKNSSHLYIGRNMTVYVEGATHSKWANPYSVKKYSSNKCLTRYENYIKNSDLINDLDELNGKILGCWCKPHKCHGDILIKLLNESHAHDKT
jgi:hypothetical protein